MRRQRCEHQHCASKFDQSDMLLLLLQVFVAGLQQGEGSGERCLSAVGARADPAVNL